MKKFVYFFLLIFLLCTPAYAYVRATFKQNNVVRPVFWQQTDIPVKWAMTSSGSADLGFGDVFRALNHSFGRWENVTYTNVVFSYTGNITPVAIGNDGFNVLAFDTDGSLLSQGASTIATTQFFISVSTGRLLDVDIVFNDKDFTFSTGSSQSGQQSHQAVSVSAQDLEAVAVHEIGHLIGLDHAIIGTEVSTAYRPTMTPFAIGVDGQTLEHDDRAGAGAIYPGPNFFSSTGNITGNVYNNALNQEIFGAHLAALDAITGRPVAAVLSGYRTGKGVVGQGDYLMLGLEPGNYTLKVMPMDGSNGINSRNFNGIFADSFVTSFKTQFYPNVFTNSQAKNISIAANSLTAASFVGVIADLSLTSENTSKKISNESTAQFVFTVTNKGNDKDTFSFSLSDTTGVTASLNQTSISLAEGEQAAVLLSLTSGKAGQYPVRVTTISATNSSATAGINVTIFVVADLDIILISPQNKTLTSSANHTFSCNATGLSLQAITLFHNMGTLFSAYENVPVSGETGQATFTVTNSPEGAFVWACSANDTQLKSVFSQNRTLTVDRTAPYIALSLNATLLERGYDTLALSWAAQDAYLQSAFLNVTRPDGTLLYQRTNQEAFILLPANLSLLGTYVVDVVATDSVGNSNGSRISFRVIDTTSPSVTLLFPSDKTITASRAVTFSCNATDPTGLANVTLYHSGGGSFTDRVQQQVSSTTANTSFAASSLSEGIILWNCLARDVSNNYSFAPLNFSFTVDQSAPLVHSVLLNDSYVGPAASVFVTVNATDAFTDVVNSTANGVLLQRTGAVFSGNVPTTSTQGEHIMRIVASDNVSNTVTHFVSYEVDTLAPVVIPYSPLATGTVLNEDALSVLWQVTDENISTTSVSVDGRLISVSINKTIGTQNFSVTFSGLLTGSHIALFRAEDNASNRVMSTLKFVLSGKQNITLPITRLMDANTNRLKGITYRDAQGQQLTGVILLNQTIIKDFVANESVSRVPISVNITAYGESYLENNAGLVKIETDQASSIATALGSSLDGKDGKPPVAFIVFQNMSQYLPEEGYALQNGTKTFVTINFNRSLAHLIPFYVVDDFGNDVRLLSSCSNNAPPASEPSLASMCYTNSSTHVTLYLPHLSGGGLYDPSNAPTITVTAPETRVNNSLFTAQGTVLDLNLDVTSCYYNMTNETGIVLGNTAFTPTLIAPSTTNYTFSFALANLVNGTNYTLALSCASTDNNRTTINSSFSVTDITPPQTTVITTTGTSSSTSSGVLAVTYTTDEAALCGFNSSSPTTLYTSFSQTNTNLSTLNGKIHSYSLPYTVDGTITVPSVICRDSSANSQSIANQSFSVSVDVTELQQAAGGGSGGGGGKATPRVNSPAVLRHAATNIKQGQVVTFGMINNEIAITHLHFTAQRAIPFMNVTITRLDGKPKNTPILEGQVYQYLDVFSVPPEWITNVSLDFRVVKDWLDLHNINTEDIALYLLDGGRWTMQSTKQLGMGSSLQVLYTANVSHLSLLAIAAPQSGNVLLEERRNETQEEIPIQTLPPPEQISPQQEEIKVTSSSPVRLGVISVMTLLLLGGIIWIWYRGENQ